MKIVQHLNCDGAGVNRVEITDAAAKRVHSDGVSLSIPVGTDKRGYMVIVEMTIFDLLDMTSTALAREADARMSA